MIFNYLLCILHLYFAPSTFCSSNTYQIETGDNICLQKNISREKGIFIIHISCMYVLVFQKNPSASYELTQLSETRPTFPCTYF